jgi:hypothetical protein
MSLRQRLLPAVLAKKASRDEVILPDMNEFTVVSDLTLAISLAVANSSFRDLP